jgi:hypothetical protein
MLYIYNFRFIAQTNVLKFKFQNIQNVQNFMTKKMIYNSYIITQ